LVREQRYAKLVETICEIEGMQTFGHCDVIKWYCCEPCRRARTVVGAFILRVYLQCICFCNIALTMYDFVLTPDNVDLLGVLDFEDFTQCSPRPVTSTLLYACIRPVVDTFESMYIHSGLHISGMPFFSSSSLDFDVLINDCTHILAGHSGEIRLSFDAFKKLWFSDEDVSCSSMPCWDVWSDVKGSSDDERRRWFLTTLKTLLVNERYDANHKISSFKIPESYLQAAKEGRAKVTFPMLGEFEMVPVVACSCVSATDMDSGNLVKLLSASTCCFAVSCLSRINDDQAEYSNIHRIGDYTGYAHDRTMKSPSCGFPVDLEMHKYMRDCGIDPYEEFTDVYCYMMNVDYHIIVKCRSIVASNFITQGGRQRYRIHVAYTPVELGSVVVDFLDYSRRRKKGVSALKISTYVHQYPVPCVPKECYAVGEVLILPRSGDYRIHSKDVGVMTVYSGEKLL